jgi:hypothetical protein
VSDEGRIDAKVTRQIKDAVDDVGTMVANAKDVKERKRSAS